MNYRKTLLTLTGTLCLCAGAASAQDVFVYSASSATPAAAVSGVERIEFGSDGINIVSAAGAQKKVALDSFDYFLFYNREILNGITPVAAEGGLSLAYDGSVVKATSADAISSINVYSADGVAVKSLAPKTGYAEVSVASLPKGVYIVKAVSGKATAVREIIKK